MTTKIVLLAVGIILLILVTQFGMTPSSNMAEMQKPEEAMTNGPTAASERAERKKRLAERAAAKAARTAETVEKLEAEATTEYEANKAKFEAQADVLQAKAREALEKAKAEAARLSDTTNN